MNLTDEHRQWLKDQCNRYKNGKCYTLRCLKRGGYEPTHDPRRTFADLATCEAHEILLILEKQNEPPRTDS